MKAVGIGLIVLVAFLFGYEKRASCIRSEKLSLTLASFFEDLSYRISYSGEPLTAVLREMAEQLKYKSLDFILFAIDSSADGSIALSDALISAFKKSSLCRLLSYEYAAERSYSDDSESSGERYKKSEESSLIILDGENGEAPVLLKKTEPTVMGVAVVCEGGDNPRIIEKVTDTISVLCGIGSNRVSVSKMT